MANRQEVIVSMPFPAAARSSIERIVKAAGLSFTIDNSFPPQLTAFEKAGFSDEALSNLVDNLANAIRPFQKQ